jgi:hypothetical protein
MLFNHEVTPRLKMYFNEVEGKVCLFISTSCFVDGDFTMSSLVIDVKDPLETMQAMQTLTESLRDFIPGGAGND